MPVQFFGTHETGRLKVSEHFDVPAGIAKKFHTGGGKPSKQFKAGLSEMLKYMRTGALPVEMGAYPRWMETR